MKKFRAWVDDKMINAKEIKFYGDVVYVYDADDDYEYQLEPHELMMSSGVEVKGVEVFEGDIVYRGYRDENTPDRFIQDNTYVVNFVDGCFVLSPMEGFPMFTNACVTFAMSAYKNEIEVIGNVFEQRK